MVDEQDSWAGLGSNGGSASHPLCVTLPTSLSSTISMTRIHRIVVRGRCNAHL